jgi:predicted nucleic acid-binding protein
MKVFFDTNVYVAEALLGEATERMVKATQRASWRIFASDYVLDELEKVLTDELGHARRLAFLSRRRIVRRSILVEPAESRHVVPDDPNDSPILRAALEAGTDYLVTNDPHLLSMNPYHGLRIISMAEYYQLLTARGLLS